MKDKVICLNIYNDLTRAYLAKNILEENNVFSFVENENITTANPFLTNAVGGIRLMINEQDHEKAMIVLKENFLEQTIDNNQSLEYEKEETLTGIHCPKCNSTNNRKEDVSALAFVISILLLGFPIPFLKRKYFCFNCNHRWK